MDMKEYASKLAEAIGGEVVETVKNNGVVYTGVRRDPLIKNGVGVVPTLYVNEIYDNISIEDAVAKYEEMYNKVPDTSRLTDAVIDWEKARELLSIRLVNEKNRNNLSIYRSAADYGFSDLIMVPCIMDDNGSIKITDDILKNWNISEDELFEVALDHIEPAVKLLDDMLRNTGFPVFMLSECPQMYVVSNPSGWYGASSILKAKKQLQEIFPGGYIVLPCSVHECIAVAIGEFSNNINELNALVRDTNNNDISVEDMLSDNTYAFKKEDFT